MTPRTMVMVNVFERVSTVACLYFAARGVPAFLPMLTAINLTLLAAFLFLGVKLRVWKRPPSAELTPPPPDLEDVLREARERHLEAVAERSRVDVATVRTVFDAVDAIAVDAQSAVRR